MPISPYLRDLRRLVGHDLLLVPSVSIIVSDEQKRVLLVRHSEGDVWVLPGGSVDPHELPADAVVREMHEETNLTVKPVRVVGAYSGDEFVVTYKNRDCVNYIMTAFECEVIGGELRPDYNETLEADYFSQADLAQLNCAPWVAIVLGHYFEHGQQPLIAGWRPPENLVRTGGMSSYMRGLRNKVGTSLVPMPAVASIVLNEHGHVLLQERSDNGAWTPPGGAIDPREAPLDALVRENWEETGLFVEPVRLTGIYNGPEFFAKYPNGDEAAVFSLVYVCRIVSGELEIDGIESLNLVFFPPDEALAKVPPRWQRRLGDALKAETAALFDAPAWSPSALLENG